MNPRLRRLQADYRFIRDTFSGHERVRVLPVGSRKPPEIYGIEYSVPGLRMENGEPHQVETHRVELMLPRRYPAEPPYAVPKTSVFHPNIREYYCIADDWKAGTPIVDVITKIGDMIQWRDYNLASPLNDEAADWASQQDQATVFPVGNVDLGVAEVDLSGHSDDRTETRAEFTPVTPRVPVNDSDDASLVTLRSGSEKA